jgi:glycine dehydrogenase subunit 2
VSKLIFEQSVSGRRGVRVPSLTAEESACDLGIPAGMLAASPPELPEVSELEAIRHFTNLSRKNFSVDTHFYPLGSCTMKYNPRITEKVSSLDGFAGLHPLLPQVEGGAAYAQGALEVVHETERWLSEVCGMKAFTLQPMAGAHGEFTGIMLIAAYHRARGNKRTTVIVPDSSHGTNPASAAIAGYEVVTVPSDDTGCMDLEAFKAALDENVAAVMMTCPNTLGIFEKDVREIADICHANDTLVYYDGANMNALLGRARPGDLGFDVVHLNLHKTFSTPHGGGGPGAGPVGVGERLLPYLPVSRVEKQADGSFALDYDAPQTIGFIAPFYGNFGMLLRAYAYMLMLGSDGLRETGENAVLSSCYVRKKLEPWYDLPFKTPSMHECVFSATRQLAKGVSAMDIAKALLDEGFHAPTVYFPLIVKEAMMIEPTETESKEELDRFVAAMIRIAERAEAEPEAFADMPLTMPLSRLDESKAVKDKRFSV